jgi:hypothetical protein
MRYVKKPFTQIDEGRIAKNRRASESYSDWILGGRRHMPPNFPFGPGAVRPRTICFWHMTERDFPFQE